MLWLAPAVANVILRHQRTLFLGRRPRHAPGGRLLQTQILRPPRSRALRIARMREWPPIKKLIGTEVSSACEPSLEFARPVFLGRNESLIRMSNKFDTWCDFHLMGFGYWTLRTRHSI